ncbi:MAG: acylphosphatase [Myxococcota bacterium]|jgi:acylphosphatase
MTRVHLVIHGHVQGVYYRASTQEVAQGLSLFGWVRNRSDGTVELVAEGPEDRVQELVEWCNQGPTLAQVDRIDRFVSEPIGLDGGFNVRPTL